MKIENLPDGGILRNMVVRVTEDGKFWYYDSYDSSSKARRIAKAVLGAVVEDYKPEVNNMPLHARHYRYIIVRVAGGAFQYCDKANSLEIADQIAKLKRGAVLRREDICY